MSTKHGAYLINPHGRRVHVLSHRVESLLKEGYQRAVEKPAADPADDAGEDGHGMDADAFEAQLEELTKAKIVEYAEEEFGLELSESSKKDELIAAVMEAAQS